MLNKVLSSPNSDRLVAQVSVGRRDVVIAMHLVSGSLLLFFLFRIFLLTPRNWGGRRASELSFVVLESCLGYNERVNKSLVLVGQVGILF